MGATTYKIKNGTVIYSEGIDTKVLSILGESGELFAVEDNLIGLIHHVSDISGIPIFRVWSDNTLKAGLFDSEAITIKESNLKQFILNTNTGGGTILLDMDKSSNVKRFLLGGNITINFGTNPEQNESSSFLFVFKQDGTGGRTVTWNAEGEPVLWDGGSAPVVSSDPNTVSAISIVWTGFEYIGKKIFN